MELVMAKAKLVKMVIPYLDRWFNKIFLRNESLSRNYFMKEIFHAVLALILTPYSNYDINICIALRDLLPFVQF